MQATPDDGVWNVRKRSGQFCFIPPPIPTRIQDTKETWKDLDKII